MVLVNATLLQIPSLLSLFLAKVLAKTKTYGSTCHRGSEADCYLHLVILGSIRVRSRDDNEVSEELRKYIYNNLNQKKTDELVEIWQKNDRIEWTDEAFAVIQEILLDRLGELPPQAEPILHKQEPAKPINRKFLWVIPIALGIVGFLLAPKLWGFTSTWQKIGKPADKIEKIIGVTSGTPRLIVQTDNGDTYSLDLSRETSWVKVENLT